MSDKMPKRPSQEFYEVSKEEAKYMNANNSKNNHNNNENNNSKNNDDHFTVERDHNTSETFNYEYRVESVACDEPPRSGVNGVKTPVLVLEHAYENVKFDLNLSKKLLLHKFFRSTEKNSAIYENLCRGCGYGVFEARGHLCNFCECIVSGVEARRRGGVVGEGELGCDSSGNIYENICDKCGCIYSSEECDCCGSANANSSPVIDDRKFDIINKESSDKQVDTSIVVTTTTDKSDIKLSKSKSFNKRDKRSIFHGLLGSLKRVKSIRTPPQTPADTLTPKGVRKRLEIVHHVDGFENIFRTQETFDLQRICELKRSQTSCSDQHIYGRLKHTGNTPENSSRTLPSQLSQSHDQLLQVAASSVDGLNSSETLAAVTELEQPTKTGRKGKRPRISRPRLLRSKSHHSDSNISTNNTTQSSSSNPVKQSLYLPDSVCQWMTSLRREIHYYRSFGFDDDHIALCNPKSIPAKNSLRYCSTGSGFCGGAKHLKAPSSPYMVTNCQNIDIHNSLAVKFYNIPACRSSDVSSNSNNSDSGNCDETVTLRRQNYIHATGDSRDQLQSPVAQMVHEFKRNLMAKQMQQQRVDAGAELPTPTVTSAGSVAQQRRKRQAIYLKMDENTLNNNNGHEPNNNSNDANVNCSRKQTNDLRTQFGETATPAVDQHQQFSASSDEQGLVSRRIARQALTTSSKRCGIYERDSEFVNDILTVFETFLQRETDSPPTDESQPKPTIEEVFSDRESATIADSLNAIDSQPYQCKAEAKQVIDCAAETTLNPIDPDRPSSSLTETSRLSLITTQQQQHTSLHHSISDRSEDKQLLLAATCGSCALDQPFGSRSPFVIEQIFDVVRLIDNLLLSHSLNSIVICYDKPLSVFLQGINKNSFNCLRYTHWTQDRLVGKYRRFHAHCQLSDNTVDRVKKKLNSEESADDSVSYAVGMQKNRSADVIVADEKRNSSVTIVVKLVETSEVQVVDPINSKTKVTRVSQSEEEATEDCLKAFELSESECRSAKEKLIDSVQVLNNSDTLSIKEKSSESTITPCESKLSSKTNNEFPKTPPQRPQVPARDPNTILSTPLPSSNSLQTPPLPAKRESPIRIETINADKMTVPTANIQPSQTSSTKKPTNSDEDDIYQPIWKFKTVGEAQEHYHTDADYYDVGNKSILSLEGADDSSSMPSILISNDVEDHSEWETDDEFMFTTQIESRAMQSSRDDCSLNSSTVRSNHSGHSSVTGSTVTGFGSSTGTLASAISASLTHHLFRNIGIFYSLTEPKLRAIIYDYDRVHASVYFAKPSPIANEHREEERSPVPPPRTTSNAAGKFRGNLPAVGVGGGESVGCQSAKALAPKLQLLPDSVQAWKFLLLDVNYLDDEEDMIVSETEILRSQQLKEDIDARQTQQLSFSQRFKSASIGNLIDLPNDDDKKSITERMRNKLHRGVLKLNPRSPKSEKKSRGLFRRLGVESVYLEDGMKPKYPIFGAPLEQLELNRTNQPNVPRIVVDCVEYIERREFITSDGLYRASGNKVSIDELKQKLSESYIYDQKLLVADDIHTLTSLLKMFVRELGAPLIPQETYERLGRNLTDEAGIETLRLAFEDMCEPNRSTLKFLIRHLTNVAACSCDNRMPASNLAIVWGPCILSHNQIEFDIGRMNTLAKVLIENYERIFSENERLVC